jgi:hypothetical protein
MSNTRKRKCRESFRLEVEKVFDDLRDARIQARLWQNDMPSTIYATMLPRNANTGEREGWKQFHSEQWMDWFWSEWASLQHVPGEDYYVLNFMDRRKEEDIKWGLIAVNIFQADEFTLAERVQLYHLLCKATASDRRFLRFGVMMCGRVTGQFWNPEVLIEILKQTRECERAYHAFYLIAASLYFQVDFSIFYKLLDLAMPRYDRSTMDGSVEDFILILWHFPQLDDTGFPLPSAGIREAIRMILYYAVRDSISYTTDDLLRIAKRLILDEYDDSGVIGSFGARNETHPYRPPAIFTRRYQLNLPSRDNLDAVALDFIRTDEIFKVLLTKANANAALQL